MRSSPILMSSLVTLIVLTSALLVACTDLQVGTDTTDIAATTVVAAVEDATSSSTAVTTSTSTAAATSTTAAPTTSTAASTTTAVPATTTTTSGGLQIDPGLIQTIPSVMQIYPGLVVGAQRYEDDSPYFRWVGSWWTVTDPEYYSGGTCRGCSGAHGYVDIFFTGTGVRLIAPTGMLGGMLRVVLTRNMTSQTNETISLYSASSTYQQTVWYSGQLDYADYVVRFENVSTNPVKKVAVDAVDIWGTITAPP